MDEEKVTLFDLFKDRAESLLERWDKFHKAHPELDPKVSIYGFLQEVNDAWTESVLE